MEEHLSDRIAVRAGHDHSQVSVPQELQADVAEPPPGSQRKRQKPEIATAIVVDAQ
jgi:hypothetical protein